MLLWMSNKIKISWTTSDSEWLCFCPNMFCILLRYLSNGQTSRIVSLIILKLDRPWAPATSMLVTDAWDNICCWWMTLVENVCWCMLMYEMVCWYFHKHLEKLPTIHFVGKNCFACLRKYKHTISNINIRQHTFSTNIIHQQNGFLKAANNYISYLYRTSL